MLKSIFKNLKARDRVFNNIWQYPKVLNSETYVKSYNLR